MFQSLHNKIYRMMTHFLYLVFLRSIYILYHITRAKENQNYLMWKDVVDSIFSNVVVVIAIVLSNERRCLLVFGYFLYRFYVITRLITCISHRFFLVMCMSNCQVQLYHMATSESSSFSSSQYSPFSHLYVLNRNEEKNSRRKEKIMERTDVQSYVINEHLYFVLSVGSSCDTYLQVFFFFPLSLQ